MEKVTEGIWKLKRNNSRTIYMYCNAFQIFFLKGLKMFMLCMVQLYKIHVAFKKFTCDMFT